MLADNFHEWKAGEGGKQPYAIARQEDGQPMAFAGLSEGFNWPDGTVTRTYTIVTTKPNVGNGRPARPHAADTGTI